MQLYEKDLLELDAPVSDYLPEFLINQRFSDSVPITVRSVLTNHAGIPNDNFLHKFSAEPPPFQEILDYLNTQSTCFLVGKINTKDMNIDQ